ncbi:hypothetical protein PSE10C_00560 [Pseudomonas amygdali pv. eriobotryae]|uniref:Uncharacterized protein n=1 Tax=Pseudomonas amygdali pv. eriobotryae TaxID=129137 RepID=A0A9P3A8W4_PSEA0|nr:hypothetical protein PSE10A_02900 [Pseudomonas amygdali pv. eriobotryae]GFZ69314.1 hypothetical protein PSE10C_00560 [Pseudomonas amygdali pv. eriobotryae]
MPMHTEARLYVDSHRETYPKYGTWHPDAEGHWQASTSTVRLQYEKQPRAAARPCRQLTCEPEAL